MVFLRQNETRRHFGALGSDPESMFKMCVDNDATVISSLNKTRQKFGKPDVRRIKVGVHKFLEHSRFNNVQLRQMALDGNDVCNWGAISKGCWAATMKYGQEAVVGFGLSGYRGILEGESYRETDQ